VKGGMMTSGPDGNPLSYEDVLRPQFTAMQSSGKHFVGKSSGAAQQAEVFLETDDWQILLQ